MPGDGISAARQIASAVPETRIVMLTVSEDQNDLFEALRAGASGYLLKDTPSTRLAAALRGVLEGEAALPRVLVARLIEAFRGAPSADPSRGVLTEREWEVLRLMQKRLSTAQIAESLAIAPVTVRTHVAAILRKLRVTDRESAVRSLDPR